METHRQGGADDTVNGGEHPTEKDRQQRKTVRDNATHDINGITSSECNVIGARRVKRDMRRRRGGYETTKDAILRPATA